MSFLARQAQRERIQQIIRLINNKIRPELLRATTEHIFCARPTKDAGQLDGKEGLNFCYPTSRTGDSTATMQDTISTAQDHLPDQSRLAHTSVASSPSNPNPPLLPDKSKQSRKGSTFLTPEALTSNVDHIPVTYKSGFTNSFDGPSCADRSFFNKLKISVHHLYAGQAIPEGLFQGATTADLRTLHEVEQTLRRMVRSIDRSFDAISRTATMKFDRRMASPDASSASSRRPRRFEGQEGWETGGLKKTQWNANADWGSETAWDEVEVKRAETSMKGPGSRLRYSYIPLEWNYPTVESPWSLWEEEEEDDDTGF